MSLITVEKAEMTGQVSIVCVQLLVTCAFIIVSCAN